MSRLVLTRIPRAILSTSVRAPALKPINRYLSATQSLLNEVDTKKLIMQMRKETQLPLKNCREALVETNWDFEAAKLYLKKEAKRLGLKKMASLGINIFISVIRLADLLKLVDPYWPFQLQEQLVRVSLVENQMETKQHY